MVLGRLAIPARSTTVRKAILIALIAFAAVAAAVALPFVAAIAFETIDTLRGGCSEGEKRVFREFPQYGGRQLEPEYSGSNGCFVAFTTEDAAEDVRAYYREQLTAGGWKLDPPPPPVEAAEGQTVGGGFGATRDRYGYQVLMESPVRSGTSVVINVIERDE
jgi:hypothetical protein